MATLEQQVEELIANNRDRCRHIDFVKVPCKVTCPLPGLTFISPKALEELKLNLRNDELVPDDEFETHLFYAKHLHKAGLCKIGFPSYYSSAGALLAESTATAVGLLSPFYFQLGYELCNLLPESEWPVENLYNILKEAECKRRSYMLRRSETCDDTFLLGLTLPERKLHNVLMHGDSNSLVVKTTVRNIANFYGFEI
ncbi:GINS complex subunit Psf3 [Babesia caballi]|uniref:GINS complex subunit Psf3 n=1 Tax=Babesia caballi TaxID=5871 RepID=A0AAV4LZJ7_BABCB|nr:GINS complex subunit Psf3 [Babesia caballi]